MENENSVCFISRINKIEPIKDADKIELATINGWTSVVQKGIHSVGDLILTITTDAVIPSGLAEQWGVYGYLRNNSRVRTVRLKGVYSECILVPLTSACFQQVEKLKEGSDWMSVFGIYKYEPPAKLIELPKIKKVYFKFTEIHKAKMWKSYFNYLYNVTKNKLKKYYKDNLNFEIYHKFPNQKNVPNMFNEEDVVSITRKIHGANFRAGIVKKNYLTLPERIRKLFGDKWIDYEYIVGSHRCEKHGGTKGFYATDIWTEMSIKYNLEKKLWDLVKNISVDLSIGKGVILYGEVFGAGVQGEHYNYGLDHRELTFFDIEIDGKYQDVLTFTDILTSDLELTIVEELFLGNWRKEAQDSYEYGHFIGISHVPHEGVVVKDVSGNRRKVSKIVNPAYLIFGEKNNIEDLEAH